MADWDNITNRDDSSSTMSRDSLTNTLHRDTKIGVMDQVGNSSVDGSEPISIKRDISQVIKSVENSIYSREHYELKHQLKRSERRHSVSESKLKERLPGHRSTSGTNNSV